MDEWIYCKKNGTWILAQECPETDCDLCRQNTFSDEITYGDGDSSAREEIEDYPSDAEAASVTVHIPEIDQSCHFGPDWAADDDETLTFLEMSWQELFAEENAAEEADEDGENETPWNTDEVEAEDIGGGSEDGGESPWECEWSEGEGGESSGESGERDGGEE